MALVAARLGGIEVPDPHFRKVRTVLMQIVDGSFRGKVLFTNHGGRESAFNKRRSVDASIFTMLHFLGVPRSHSTIQTVSKRLMNDLPRPDKRNFWMLYNMGLGMFQMGSQDPEWQAFSAGPLRDIAKGAHSDGKGAFWKAPKALYPGGKVPGDTGEQTKFWGTCGRTAMATLNLQVFYRYGDIHMLYEQFGGLISEKQLTGKVKPSAGKQSSAKALSLLDDEPSDLTIE